LWGADRYTAGEHTCRGMRLRQSKKSYCPLVLALTTKLLNNLPIVPMAVKALNEFSGVSELGQLQGLGARFCQAQEHGAGLARGL
jgi:hypothetical protein